MSKNRILVLLAVLIMSTLACQAADNLLNTGAPSEGESSGQAMTKVAEYIGVGMTQTALSALSSIIVASTASPTLEQATDTSLPPPILPDISLTPAQVAQLPTLQPPPPEVATKSACTYKAYLDYETIPYGKEMPYNHAFTKIWRVRNTGNCAWEPGFELMCLKYCNDFGAPGSVILNGRVIKPGDQVEVRLAMHAPKDKKLLGKTVVSTWMIRGGGKIFGIQPDGDTALTVAVKITD